MAIGCPGRPHRGPHCSLSLTQLGVGDARPPQTPPSRDWPLHSLKPVLVGRTFCGARRIEEVFSQRTIGIMSLRSTYTPMTVKGGSGERSPGRQGPGGATATADSGDKKAKKIDWSSLPEIWALIHPRRWI